MIRDNSTIPVVFESSSVLGVQLLKSFISVVVMLLLLLSGDVETNPGPASKYNCYRYLHACTSMCIILSQCILSFGVKASIHAVALMKRSFREKVDNTPMHACIPFEERIVEFFKSSLKLIQN